MGDIDGIPSKFQLFELALPRCLVELGSFGVELFNWGKVEAHQWSNPRHSHAFYELCLVYQGKGFYQINGEDVFVSAGDLLLAAPGDYHNLRTEKENSLGIYCVSLGIYPGFKPDNANELCNLVRNFIESSERVLPAPGLERVCELISEDVVLRRLGFELSLKGLFARFVLDVINIWAPRHLPAGNYVPRRENPEQLRFQKALQYIENNYQREITLDSVAEKMYVSPRQANRLFRTVTGMPVMCFIRDYRMKVAMQMLDSTSRPIKEVAWACGYPNERNFMTRFRKHTGFTAQEFRNKRRV